MDRLCRCVVAGVLLLAVLVAPFSLVHAESITEEYLTELASKVKIDNKPGAMLIAVFEPNGSVTFVGTGNHPDGSLPSPDDAYRIGSNTKMFTAALILSLVDEGLVDLDAPAANYLTRLAVPEAVTVRQLLQHTSGLFNYTDLGGFLGIVRADPTHVWTPEEIFALVADAQNGEPGSQHSYSNTNYILLGVIIEEVTGTAYHDVLQERIIDPLRLEHTYLDGFQSGPEPVTAYELAVGGYLPIEWDYTGFATIAWAAGGIVSSSPDLHMFMTELFSGDLISVESLAEMTNTEPDDYGLGLMSNSDVPGVFGHQGGIPGFVTLVAHSNATGRTAFWAVTNEAIDFVPSVMELFAAINEP